MEILANIWQNLKKEPQIGLFYFFIATFTLQTRKILFSYPIQDQFNEFTSGFVYLSDLVLIATISVWLVILLYNKIVYLSSNTRLASQNVPRGTFCKKNILLLIIPLILVILAYISILWSENSSFALYKSIKLTEFYLLYLFVLFNLRKISLRTVFFIILGAAAIQSVVAILQFILQSSIGLHAFFRESIVPRLPAGEAGGTPGVAKIEIWGQKLYRSYGLMPHPNILGGFLAISSFLTAFVIQKCSTWNNKCSTWNIFLDVALVIQLVTLFLTFSKSAILAFVIAVILWNVPRGTFWWKKMLHACPPKWRMEHFWKLIVIILAISLIIGFFGQDVANNIKESFNDRILLYNVSRLPAVASAKAGGTILESAQSLIFGIGPGQSVFHQFSSYPHLENWQYQPVHNIYLLITMELGIIGLLAFPMWISVLLFENVPRLTAGVEGETYLNYLTKVIKCCLIIISLISLLDHYFWDIQQGQILFWLVSGFLAGTFFLNRDEFDKI